MLVTCLPVIGRSAFLDQGCFVDTTERDLPYILDLPETTITPGVCSQGCGQLAYRYSGTQYAEVRQRLIPTILTLSYTELIKLASELLNLLCLLFVAVIW